jgi:hypothetical protein
VQSGIPNLFAVEQTPAPCIYRGGQPNAEGWKWLAGEGIKVVIKLNLETEGSDKAASDLGLTVYRFPIPWWRQMLWRPRQSDLKAAVPLIIPGTFVHCEHGEDRTGLVIGCFRLFQGWSKDEAYEEMLAHCFHPTLQGLQGRWLSERAEDWA